MSSPKQTPGGYPPTVETRFTPTHPHDIPSWALVVGERHRLAQVAQGNTTKRLRLLLRGKR